MRKFDQRALAFHICVLLLGSSIGSQIGLRWLFKKLLIADIILELSVSGAIGRQGMVPR